MPQISVGQNRVFYICGKSGAKTPIVFIHGSGGGHHHWIYQVRGLADTLYPIAPDLPGHGRSTGQALGSIESYSDWLKSFIDRLGLRQFILGGHSMGGAIALDYALRWPNSLKGLVLIGTGARLRVLPELLDKLAKGIVPPEFVNYMYGPETGETLLDRARSEISSTNPSIFHSDLSACNRFDVIGRLGEIRVRALIICGSKDLLTPPKYSRFLHDQIGAGTLVEIEGAGHMVMLEKSDAVNQAIDSHFCEQSS